MLANIQLSVERRDDGKIYLSDAVMAGKVSYYALNGSVHRIDARQLSQQALPANRWLHLVKFVADIDNVNSEGWKTSHQYTGGQDTRDAASFETSFYIADGTSPPNIGRTKPLWTADTVTDALTFKATPAFSLPPGKQYGFLSSCRSTRARPTWARSRGTSRTTATACSTPATWQR